MVAVPMFRVAVDWRGRWGVQARWPRTGPWRHRNIIPRWVWHGPFGNTKTRWPRKSGADAFADLCNEIVADHTAPAAGLSTLEESE